jgi:hypothetical protein
MVMSLVVAPSNGTDIIGFPTNEGLLASPPPIFSSGFPTYIGMLWPGAIPEFLEGVSVQGNTSTSKPLNSGQALENTTSPTKPQTDPWAQLPSLTITRPVP